MTGSGKTTTCHKLLREARRPFLVIEPAKTEYREFINHFDDVVVFTVGDEMTAPLRLNPFELVEGENVSAHIDMLKATFVSSFPMEASMPQLIEEAICKIYEDTGWVFDDERLRAEEFPTLDDFLRALETIVDTKGFSERLRDDYRGSLVSRFSNLTKGTKGALLNCQRSVNFDRLLDRNVVIEMENLKSAEDKALVMGFILTRLSAAIKHRHAADKSYRHITLIEEAHRLLSKVEYGDSGSKRTAVETFTDMLAEIRKYGESLIVVDQIPNKLASEVLKNTNTKIIHRLFARDDKEAVGDTMLMDDRQKEYLSALEIGQAIVFSEGMSRPIHIQIDAATHTGGVEVSNAEVKQRFKRHFGEQYRRMELTRRFYRPLESLLSSIAEEFITSGALTSGTIFRAEQLIVELKSYEAGDDDLIVEHLAAEYSRRHGRDRLFRRRLEKFLERLIAGDDEPLDYEAYR
ncbi:MAG: ATP-binding protein, partial [Selenomonadaceae bacterium]|nr:ATP-binding protein [Selenomonadaceae bacterium]